MKGKGEWITVRSDDGGEFGVYLAVPAAGSGPALLVLQEIFGVNKFVRDQVEEMADHGYLAAAPDLFWRIEPRLDLPYSEEGVAKGHAVREKFDVERAVADMAATIAALKARPECAGKVGAVGYCMGGLMALLAATRCGIDCGISYYGTRLDGYLDDVAQLAVPFVFHFPEKDRVVPPETVARIKERIGDKPHVEAYDYPDADHGFAAEGRPVYDYLAASVSRSRTLSFLHRVIGPRSL